MNKNTLYKMLCLLLVVAVNVGFNIFLRISVIAVAALILICSVKEFIDAYGRKDD